MSRFSSLFALVFAATILAGAATSAHAQGNQRPYRGLFGSGYGNVDQSLVFNASLGTGYDTNVLRGRIDPDAEDPNVDTRRSSRFTGATAGLGYSLRRNSFSFGASLSTSLSYYESLREPRVNGYGTGVTFSWRPHYRLAVSANQNLSYGPFFNGIGGSLPSVLDLGGPPLEFLNPDALIEDRLVSSTAGTVSYSLTRNLAANVGYVQVDDLWASGIRDLSTKQGSVGLSYGRQVKRFLSFRVGYNYQVTEFRGTDLEPQWVGTHMADVNLNFGRNGGLQLDRRTRLTFGVGMGSGRGLRPGDRVQYTVTGNVGLVRDVGRTFQASLTYTRGLVFNAFFRQPVLQNQVWAGYGGLLSRRLRLFAMVGGSHDEVGLGNVENNQLNNVMANAGLGYALSRTLSLNLSYFYTQFDVARAVELPDGLDRTGDRHTVRASLGLNLPIFTRTRTPNASR